MIAERVAQAMTDARSVALDGPAERLYEVFGGGRTLAGTRVNADTALALPAFYAAVKILAESMGVMPMEVLRFSLDRVATQAPDSRLWDLLYDSPNPEMHAGDFWEIVTAHIAIRGNAYAFKQRDEYGRVVALWPLPAHRVTVQRHQRSRRKEFLVSLDADDPVVMPFESYDILHFRGFGPGTLMGLSPIGAMRELLGRATAEQDYSSSLMANHARPGGILKMPAGKTIDAERGRRLARRFRRSVGGRRVGETVVLEEGMEWQQVSLTAADAQFVEQREFTTRDVARFTRVPADMLLVATGGDLHYTSDESAGLRFLTFTLMPWIRRIEGPLSIDQDLPWLEPSGRRLRPQFQSSVLLRVDRKTRFETWGIAIDRGWMTPDEVRLKEGLAPKGASQLKPVTGPASPQSRSLPKGDYAPDDVAEIERVLDAALN